MDIRNATRPAKGTTTEMMLTPVKDGDNITAPFNADGTLNIIPEDLASDMVLVESWKYVKENGLTEMDLHNLLDSLLTTGNVAWDFKLFNNVSVTFKVRESWVDDLIIERIDDLTAHSAKVSALRYNNLVAEMNLAASMIKFGDRSFDVTDEGSFKENLKFVRQLAYIYRNKLVNKLAVFDRAVTIATTDWALANFMPPLSDAPEQSSSSVQG